MSWRPGVAAALLFAAAGAPVALAADVSDDDVLTIMRKQPDGRWLLARDANLMVTK